MQEENNNFGMTEQEINTYKRQTLILKVKLFLENIAPAIVKIISVLLYYLTRFIKALVSTIFKMILGKEV